MKLISFAVPSYNSEAYLHKCIDSLLVGGEEVEIIIVNDGSKDGTAAIADEYAAKYPTIVRAIHKENGGHGSGVNYGLRAATGLYYKVVDSDDWADADALKALLDKIKEHLAADTLPDMYFVNYVYEHVEDNTQYVNRDCARKMPKDKFFGWNDVKEFHLSDALMMHAMFYNREKLLSTGLELPEKTFYVDEIFAYAPLPAMKKLYYLDVDFYRYYIGRVDQSVNIASLTKRYEQHIRVFKELIKSHSYDDIKSQPKGLRKYMMHMMSVYYLLVACFTNYYDDPERRANYKELWAFIKETDIKMYKKLRYRSMGVLINFWPWKFRGFLLRVGYAVVRKFMKVG